MNDYEKDEAWLQSLRETSTLCESVREANLKEFMRQAEKLGENP